MRHLVDIKGNDVVTDLPLNYDASMIGIGDRIRELRRSRNWSQQQLGEKARGKRKSAINKETINRIEHGCNTTTDTLRDIAEAFDVTVGDLLPIEHKPSNERQAEGVDGTKLAIKPAHEKLHEYFEYILCTGSPQAGWLAGNIATFYAQLTGTEPDTGAVAAVQAGRVSGDPGELHDLPEPSVGVANRRSRSKHGWRG